VAIVRTNKTLDKYKMMRERINSNRNTNKKETLDKIEEEIIEIAKIIISKKDNINQNNTKTNKIMMTKMKIWKIMIKNTSLRRGKIKKKCVSLTIRAKIKEKI
jgi:hypothetical protein